MRKNLEDSERGDEDRQRHRKLLNVEWWCRLGLSDLVKRSWKEVFKKATKSWVVWWWIGSKFQSKDLLTPSSYAGSGQQQARHWQQQSLCRLCRSIVEHPATSCWEGWRQEKDTGATLQELIPTVSLPFSHPLSLLLFLALLTCSSWASKCQETSSALGSLSCKLVGDTADLSTAAPQACPGVYSSPIIPTLSFLETKLWDEWSCHVFQVGHFSAAPLVKCLWPLTCSCVNALCLQLSHQSHALRPDPCLGL